MSKDKKQITTTNKRNIDSEKFDYYATDPIAIDYLLEVESFKGQILECAVGGGHLANRLEEKGFDVTGVDIIDRGYKNTKIASVFELKENKYDVITNPPYKIAREFIEHIIKISDNGVKIAMFLKLTFLESKRRRDFFEKYPPKVIYVSRSRIICAKNGNFNEVKSSAVAYAWYIWEVGYEGNTIIDWIN